MPDPVREPKCPPYPPPHALHRRQPLPEHHPKSPQDDAAAPEAVRKILACWSYREADKDLDFLKEPQTRGVRLQLDYSKAEGLLAKHRVAHTIVVFGGTRIVESNAAIRTLKEIDQAIARDPENEELRRKRSIADRVLQKSKYYDMAREFGRIVGRAEHLGRGDRIVVMTGGGPGIMEAANRGASDVGARSVGLNITLPHEQFPNPYVTPELCLRFHYFAIRKLHFLLRARALVAFPGGYGTLDELFEILALSQTRKAEPVPIVLVGEDYWRKVFDVDFLVDEGVIDAEDKELLWYTNSAEETWESILRWYDMKGEPLLKRETT
ncbi:MAG TPA: TIGR00730 family Rossman fold protein [Micropepsaceae bacterium]|nr:TIGR00730 family Rossman fold protein [Micropepsaceae bacterium]